MAMSTDSISTMPHRRYVVGIDLGTTHTVVAYADTTTKSVKADIALLNIDQLVMPGEIDARPLLPSVCYRAAPGELHDEAIRLPWSDSADPPPPIVGELARRLGAKSHGRLVTSAKSWLSHGAVDRTAPILPWGATEDVSRISPVTASAIYLAHVRAAWNHRFPDHPLQRQDVIVTLPASFDESARSLTLEAAKQAGLENVHLLEEPQAACYDWLWVHRKNLLDSLANVRLLLVVDVGGGTTDLTLIRVDAQGEGDEPALTRIGVGNHLMLGGDNIDLSLAHLAERHLISDERRLSSAQLAQLIDQCRTVKERLLTDESARSATVTLLGGGSRLIGDSRSVELDGMAVRQQVLDGFFPLVDLTAQPDRKRSGVVEFGLPYQPDPAITKHLATFLSQHCRLPDEHRTGIEMVVPDAILLNGGVFRSPLITKRMLEQMTHWLGREPKLLVNERPELAVAHGAVAYGLVRRGLAGQRIGGGSARSYFLLVESAERGGRQQGVCLLPRGTEEGRELILSERNFALRLGQPVRFHLLSSTEDHGHSAGEVVDIDEGDFIPLPPLAVALKQDGQNGNQEIQVRLAVALTEVGTLAIQCIATDDPAQRWDVTFQIRQGSTSETTLLDRPHPGLQESLTLIHQIFGKKTRQAEPKAVRSLRNDLEKLLGKRENWDTGLLRELFSALLEDMPHRRRSPEHERAWLNLTGYCLRPGFGVALDDWRVERIWSIYEQGIQYVNEPQNWAEWWTLWRRICGGLGASAQAAIFRDLANFINPETARRGNLLTIAKKRACEDMLRLAASLERIPASNKCELGEWLLGRLGKGAESAEIWWAIGRVGARVPFHGSAHEVVPTAEAEAWIMRLLEIDWKKNQLAGFAAALIARTCDDRDREVSAALRARVVEKLRGTKAPETWVEMTTTFKPLDMADVKRAFGEGLPPGLKLLN